MEEKRTGTPPPAVPAAESSVSDAPTSSRRRGGSQKRKSSSLGGGNTSTPQTTKRQAREKPPPVPFPPIHNGPLTRARQQPNNSFSAAGSPLPSGVKSELEEMAQAEAGGGEMLRADQLNEAVKEDWEALEARIEADYEAIRSRDSNAHVVPNHAGWFSWTKIHPLEEKTLLSFFNGKSESRTPEIYMEIRNWIMKKFHDNPNTSIELKDLSEISVGELDARQEVMEFLDYWGLINYHPFPGTDVLTKSIDGATDKATRAKSLVESLFRFESEQSCVPIAPWNCVSTPSVPTGLFPESSIVEELVKSEGPGVEYHCNSCSADCSRKRYHCQKQADFDLCSDCFNNGKFNSDMSPSDFIIMEAAEAGGSSGGNWTDQETLLLLEALELFSENWNEIAEHVATKTKAQCILHFVQMPIEDAFFDSSDEINDSGKRNSNAVSINNDTSAQEDSQEMTESNDKANGDKPSSPVRESSKPEVVDGSTVHKNNENFVVKALTEAFEAVGSLPSPSGRLSFAEAGNPVMTLAAFLVRLLEPNIATASARSSLKSISVHSSGVLLALRHCYGLEGPSDDKKFAHMERADPEMAEQETPKNGEQNAAKEEENDGPAIDGVHESINEERESSKDCVREKGETLASPSLVSADESASGKELSGMTHEETEPTHINESKDPDFPKEPVSIATKKSNDLAMEVEVPPGFERDPDDAAQSGEPSVSTKVPMDKDMLPDLEVEDSEKPAIVNSVAENEANEEAKTLINKEKCASEMKTDLTDRMKTAAVTALSAAAVKAKLIADQEEEQIHHLATHLIEKQLLKLETKLAFFSDMENVVMRVREQLERSKQRLFHERAQIIATRLGISASRPMAQSLPINRVAMAFANAVPRPIIGIASPQPPISKPTCASNLPLSSFLPANAAGSSVQPSNQDQLPSVGTK